MEVLVIAVVIVLVVIGAFYAWKAEQERRRAIQQFAAELGFRFDPDPDPDHDDDYAQFEIFRKGHSRAAFNTMVGSLPLLGRSCHTRCGDFRYRITTHNGKSTTTTTYRFSYLIAHVPWPGVQLLVRPEGVFDKLAGAIGFDDIDFESAEFSRKFYVKSPDKRFAYDVLHPRMMEFLLAERPPMIELEDGAVCISDGSSRWNPADYRRMIAFLNRFFELWPRHLVRELEGR